MHDSKSISNDNRRHDHPKSRMMHFAVIILLLLAVSGCDSSFPERKGTTEANIALEANGYLNSNTSTMEVRSDTIAVPNGSFEELDANGMPEHWTMMPSPGLQTAESNTAQTHHGQRSLRIVNPPGDTYVGIHSASIPAKANAIYTASVWIYSESNWPARFFLQFFNSGGSRLHHEYSQPPHTSGWQKVSVTGVAPPGTVSLNILIYGSTTTSGISIHDDVTLIQQLTPGNCDQLSVGGIGGVIDVTKHPYNVQPGNGDAYPGIQAAINYACETRGTLGPTPVYLPVGKYATSKPINIPCHNQEMYGACKNGSIIAPQFDGPAVVMTAPAYALPTGTSLVGSGSSGRIVPWSNGYWYINLRDIPAVELNGMTSFTAETFFKATPSQSHDGDLISSYGCSASAGSNVVPCGSAFVLWVFNSRLEARIKIGTQVHILSDDNPIAEGQIHHAALTYDGSTVRLFKDGVLVKSRAASGSIVQESDEVVAVGARIMGFEKGPIFNAREGYIDSVRLSNTARYTEDFTPTSTKFNGDINTLALINFDGWLPGLLQVHTSGQPFWVPVRSYVNQDGTRVPPTQSGAMLGGIRLHDFSVLGGMGVVGWFSTQSRIYHMKCVFCDYGFSMLGNNYLGKFDDIDAIASASAARSRFGLVSTVANGNGYHDVRAYGQTFPVVIAGGAQGVFTNLSILAGERTVFGSLLFNTSTIVNGVDIDASNALTSAWRGGIAAVSPWGKLHIQHGRVGNSGAGAPILFQGAPNAQTVPSTGAGVLIQGTSFEGTATTTEVLRVYGEHKPNIIVAAKKDSVTPWSNDPNFIWIGSDPSDVPDSLTLAPAKEGPASVRGMVPVNKILDVSAFGAVGDAVSDDSPAIQAAVDAACSEAEPRSTIFIPVGRFSLHKPVVVHCDGLTIEGASRDRSELRPRWPGPAFILRSNGMSGIDLVPTLVSGPGYAMRMNESAYWLDLRDAVGPAELDSLEAFTAEGFIKVNSVPTGYAGILQSHGCVGSGAPLPGCTSAFALAVMNSRLVASLTTNTMSLSLESGVLPPTFADDVHHVALSYDGAYTRLFLDGVAVDSRAASGPIRQALHEDVSIGPRTTGFGFSVKDLPIDGIVDSIRLSNSARYTSNFSSPINKLTNDGNTLVVLNFEDNANGMTRGRQGSNGSVWIPIRRVAEPDGSPSPILQRTIFHQLAFTGNSGIFGMNATNGSYHAIRMHPTGCAIDLAGSSAGSLFDDLMLVGGRCGLKSINGSGNVYRNVTLAHHQIPTVVAGGSGQQVLDMFVATLLPGPNGAPGAPYGSYFLNAGVTVEGLYFDNEDESADWLANMVLVDLPAELQLFKGEIDSVINSSGKPIILDGGAGIKLLGTSLYSSQASELIYVRPGTSSVPNVTAIGITYTYAGSIAPAMTNGSNLVSIGN